MRQKVFNVIRAATLLAFVSAAIWFYLSYQKKPGNAYVENLYQITTSDPLFYSPNLDTSRLRESVAKLEEKELEFKRASSEILSKRLQKNGEEPYDGLAKVEKTYYQNFFLSAKQNSLYPFDFLYALKDVGDKTNLFLQNKTAETGIALLRSYKKTADAYQKNAENQRKILETLLSADPGEKQRRYISLAAYSNISILLKDFKIIEKNADVLKQEIEKRETCFWKGNCDFPIVENNRGEDIISASTSKTVRPDAYQAVPEELLEPLGQNSGRLGPYLIKTDCFGDYGEDVGLGHIVYILLTKDDLFIPKLATNNFYERPEYDSSEYGKKVARSGLKYDFQHEGFGYMCPNLEYWTDLSLQATGDKTTYLPEMINSIAANLPNLTLRLKFGQKLYPPVWLIGFQSGYSIAYLPFLKSVWRLEEHPAYLAPAKQRSPAYVAYTELRKVGFNDAEIKAFHFSSEKLKEGIVKELEAKTTREYDNFFFVELAKLKTQISAILNM